MAKHSKSIPQRGLRVADQIQKDLSELIAFEVKDPRVKNVTVTRAEVSADLQHAKVYVSIMGSEQAQRTALYGLENAAGFVQAKLAKRLTTRYVPHVTFVKDDGVKKSIEIARIIREALGPNAEGAVSADAEGETEGSAGRGAAEPSESE